MNDLLLPGGSHMIHIGPHKTGSTALQQSMHAHRETLLEHGVYYASLGGDRAREATRAVLGGGNALGRPAPRMSQWNALVEEVRSTGDLRVVSSSEDYARATDDQARAVVEGIGGEQPHVVYVVRRLDKYFPSHWQERVKARETRSYEDWLKIVLSEPSNTWLWKHVWVPYQVEEVVRRWTDLVGKENMTLVIADESDRMHLPNSFESMLGIPSGTLTMDARRGNRSLTFSEAEFLRAVNVALAESGTPNWAYYRFVQGPLVRALRHDPHPTGHQPLDPVPDWAFERIAELANAQADAVRDAGVRVLGDPEQLREVRRPDVAAQPSQETDQPLRIDLDTVARVNVALIERAIALAGDGQGRRGRTRPRTRDTDKQPMAGSQRIAQTSTRELVKVVGRRVIAKLHRS